MGASFGENVLEVKDALSSRQVSKSVQHQVKRMYRSLDAEALLGGLKISSHIQLFCETLEYRPARHIGADSSCLVINPLQDSP